MNELSSGRAVFLVARREFVTRVRGRIFVVGTVMALAALAAYALLQVLVLDRISTTPSFVVGFSADARALAVPLQRVAPAIGIIVHVSDVADEVQGESQVRTGKLDAFVTGAPDTPRVVVESRLDPQLGAALTGLARQEALDAQLRGDGLDPAAVQTRAEAASVHVQVLQPPNPNGYQQPILGVVIALVLYVFLGIYGNVVAQGIVAEKASRVVEILLSALRPAQLLLGKVIGIGLIGLLQLLVIGAAGLAFTLPTHVLTIPATAAGAVAGGVLWFVLGFLFYALLLGMAASPVSRLEEVSSATLPVILLLVFSWLLAVGVLVPALSAPSASSPIAGLATASAVLSLIPPFAPVLMPIRLVAEDVPTWQTLLAVALELASIAGLAWLAARVYAGSVLRFGARIRLVDAFRRAP